MDSEVLFTQRQIDDAVLAVGGAASTSGPSVEDIKTRQRVHSKIQRDRASIGKTVQPSFGNVQL